MGIVGKSASERIDALQMRLNKTMTKRKIVRKDALDGFTDEQLRDLDSVLQIAYFIRHRQDASSRAEHTLEQVIKIIECAAADIEGSEHRSEEILARAEAAIDQISESHRRAMPRLEDNHAHGWFKQFNKY